MVVQRIKFPLFPCLVGGICRHEAGMLSALPFLRRCPVLPERRDREALLLVTSLNNIYYEAFLSCCGAK